MLFVLLNVSLGLHGLGVNSASAQSLKNVSKYIYDFDFLEFSFFKCYQFKNGFLISSKLSTFARSKGQVGS
jgi:hypothetical protein